MTETSRLPVKHGVVILHQEKQHLRIVTGSCGSAHLNRENIRILIGLLIDSLIKLEQQGAEPMGFRGS